MIDIPSMTDKEKDNFTRELIEDVKTIDFDKFSRFLVSINGQLTDRISRFSASSIRERELERISFSKFKYVDEIGCDFLYRFKNEDLKIEAKYSSSGFLYRPEIKTKSKKNRCIFPQISLANTKSKEDSKTIIDKINKENENKILFFYDCYNFYFLYWHDLAKNNLIFKKDGEIIAKNIHKKYFHKICSCKELKNPPIFNLNKLVDDCFDGVGLSVEKLYNEKKENNKKRKEVMKKTNTNDNLRKRDGSIQIATDYVLYEHKRKELRTEDLVSHFKSKGMKKSFNACRKYMFRMAEKGILRCSKKQKLYIFYLNYNKINEIKDKTNKKNKINKTKKNINGQKEEFIGGIDMSKVTKKVDVEYSKSELFDKICNSKKITPEEKRQILDVLL